MEINSNYENIIHNSQNRIVVHPMTRNMNFVATFAIIYGVIQSITIIGALIGIPVIFASLRLKEAAEAFKYFGESNDPSALFLALEKQSRSFYILRILIIVSLVFYGLLIIGFLLVFLPMFMSNYHYNFN
jgi:hypothetical protein